MINTVELIIEQTSEQIVIAKKRSSIYIVSRLFVFILFLIEILRGFANNILIEKMIGIICFCVFLFLLILFNDISKKIRFLENKLKICSEIENQSSNDGESLFTVPDSNHPFSNDLDIFGKKSLFEKINRCQTLFGKEILIEFLMNPLLKINNIENRQNAVKELSSKMQWNVDFLATIKSTELQSNILNNNAIKNWLDNDFNNFNSSFKFILIIVPIFNLLFFSLVLILNLPTIFVLLPILISFFINKFYRKQVLAIYSTIDFTSNELKKIKSTLELIENENFTSIDNKILKEKLIGFNSIKSSKSINDLSKLIDAFENRNNILVSSILNIFLLWDLKYTYKIEKHINSNRDFIPNWFSAMGEFEAIISFSLFAYKNNEFHYPICSETRNVIDVISLSHPLIPKGERVYNDFSTIESNNVTIVTGANMTGKSTFLRSVGINMVLAMNGCPVCAESFIFSPISIFTSMSTSDSLSDGSSYFNAEIQRLKLLIEKLENNEPQFIILDEILKGTNSVDKLKGSELFLDKIIKMKTFNTCLIATHDLELTKMENLYPNNIINYCFELHNKDGSLEPDYKLQRGVTKSMNAIELMRKNHIID